MAKNLLVVVGWSPASVMLQDIGLGRQNATGSYALTARVVVDRLRAAYYRRLKYGSSGNFHAYPCRYGDHFRRHLHHRCAHARLEDVAAAVPLQD